MRLIGRHVAVFGLKNTGKSNLVQYLLSMPQYQGHLVYDLCQEHSALNRYVPSHRRGSEAEEELEEVAARTVTNQDREMRPDVFAVEEVSRFCSPQSQPPPAVYELVDLARHYRTGLLTVARRPAQVHADLVDLADTVIYFRLKGKNDRRALNRTIDGLGDVVRNLPDYHFARVTGDHRVYVHPPVPEMDTTGRL